MLTVLVLRPLKFGLLNVIAGFLYESLPFELRIKLWQLAPAWWQYIDNFVIGIFTVLMASALGAFGKPFFIKLI